MLPTVPKRGKRDTCIQGRGEHHGTPAFVLQLASLCTSERALLTKYAASHNICLMSDHGIKSSSSEGAAQRHHCSHTIMATPTLVLGTLLLMLLPQGFSLCFPARCHLSDLKC